MHHETKEHLGWHSLLIHLSVFFNKAYCADFDWATGYYTAMCASVLTKRYQQELINCPIPPNIFVIIVFISFMSEVN